MTLRLRSRFAAQVAPGFLLPAQTASRPAGRRAGASLMLTLAVALPSLATTQFAHADDTTQVQTPAPVRSADGIANDTTTATTSTITATPDSKWKIGVGPGLVVTPKYPGSRQLSYIPFPSLDISYDDRFFSQGPDVLGVNVLRGPAYHLGAALSFDFQSRKESDDPHLHGLGDVDGGPKLKLFADYTVWAFTGSVALYQDIAGHHQGTTISTDLVASAPMGGWLLSVGPGFTWANGTYMRTFFGVTPQQSAASGLPVYNASAGIRDIHMNAMLTYDFSRHWDGSIAATFGRLKHSAGHSPITEKRFELNTLASVNYKF